MAVGPLGRGSAADGLEVKTELQLAALGADSGAAGTPAVGAAGDARRGHVAAIHDRAETRRPLLGRLARDRRQPFDERPELVLAKQADDRVAVVVAQASGLEVDRDRQVAHDRREVLAHVDLVAVFAELVAELLRRHLVEAGEERVEVAELADHLRSGLLADAGDARDVVGRVALERLVVDHLIGTQPESLVDPCDVVHHGVLDAGSGRHQSDARGHELEHVEVDGHDRGFEVVARVELLGDRPDNVVRLVALHLVDRDPEGLDDLANLRELVAQVVGHLRPRRLVLGVLLVPEGWPGQVERDREVVGLEILQAAKDDAGEAEHPVDEVAREVVSGGRAK